MKKLILILTLGACLALAHAQTVDRIIAKVGTDIILMSDVQKKIVQIQQAGLADENVTPAAVLQQLIEEKLIHQKAQDLDIKVDKEKIKNYASRYLEEIKSKYPNEAEFAADLRKENMTETDLLDYYVDLITKNTMSDQLISRYVSSKVTVSDAEMRSFYAASKDSLAVKPVTWETGLIMRETKPSEETEASVLAQIRAIQDRLDRGEDFAALARELSDCPSREQGGDLGYFSKGMMVKPFEDAAFTLETGEISDVVKTQYGFHLIKLTDKRNEEVKASHILKILSPTAADSLAARQLMETVRGKFHSGEASFADLARQYSSDPEVEKSGGIIGEFGLGEFPELFSAQIEATPVGQMTPVLENEGMLYLFARLREVPSRVFTFEEVKDKVREYISTAKQMTVYNQWMKELISESYVQIIN